jgi:hypothetical protein
MVVHQLFTSFTHRLSPPPTQPVGLEKSRMKLIFTLLATLLMAATPHSPNPTAAKPQAAAEAQTAPYHHPIEKFIR